MLSDARTLWQSATTALSSLNDNITSNIANALDQLDEEAEKQANLDHMQQTLTNEIEDQFNTDDTADEITIYKQLLQECQLNIVDLSRQSKVILIEKDAEIERYKASLQAKNISPILPSTDTPTIDSNSTTTKNSGTNDTSIQIAQLTAEKKAYEESLIHIQEQLKESIQTKIQLKTLANKNIIYQNKIKNLLYTIAEYKLKHTQLEQEKCETVEQLVSEYSKLASESEIQHLNNISVINKLKLDKEEMALTIETLHHNISDFADRAASNTTTTGHTSTTNTASIAEPPLATASATIVPKAVPISHDDQAAGAAPVPLSVSSTALQQQQQEVKELKAKLINLQYDKKQQADEILSLQTQLQALKSSLSSPSSKLAPPTPSIPTDHTDNPTTHTATDVATTTSAEHLQTLSEANAALDIEVSNLKQDVLRLQIEKNEAIAAGKLIRDQSKQHEAQHQSTQVAYKAVMEEKAVLEVSHGELQRVLQELRDNHTSTQTLNNTALAEKEASLLTLSTTLDALQKQYDELLHDSQHQKLLFEQTAIESASSLAAFTQLESDYKVRIEELEASHTEAIQQLQQVVATYKENNITLTDQLTQLKLDLESQINALTEKHVNELQTQRAELEASHSQSILTVREQSEAAIKALELRHTEEQSATTSSLNERHRLELDEELKKQESHLQQAFEGIKASLISEHDLALEAILEQHQLALLAQSEALSAAYREEAAVLTQRLNEEHAQALAAMQATHASELTALQQHCDQLTEKLKETEAK